MIEIFDAYELRARIAPAVIVISPLIFSSVVFISSISPNLLSSTIAGIGSLALIYALSLIIRHLGKSKEQVLWSSWGGAPSIQMLRPNNSTFSDDIKRTITKAVKQRFSIDIEGTAEESGENLDQRIEDAFRLVRQRVQQLDPSGLWYKHNAEYGFLRNLYASCWIWILNSILVCIVGGVTYYINSNFLYIVISVSGAMFAVIALVLYKYLLLRPLRTAAERYAESTWISFLHLENVKV